MSTEEDNTTGVVRDAEEDGKESPGGSVAEDVHEGEESGEPIAEDPHLPLSSPISVEALSLNV